MSASLPLLAVPNVSEGREQATIDALATAFRAECGVRLLDVHSDVDHNRSVFTLAGIQGELSRALLAGARVAVRRIDVGEGRNPASVGEHPHVGAVDVMPVVYLHPDQQGAACAQALVIAHDLGEQLGLPVFLYGELAAGRSRAQLRHGGVSGLAARLGSGELRPDFGPTRLHPSAGATLVGAREPLVAFNVELSAPAGVAEAKHIASLIREGGPDGIPGVRAIGLRIHREGVAVAQVSMNIERPLQTPLAEVINAVRRHGDLACGELVGLAPAAALEGLPDDVPLRGFDRAHHVIENRLGF